MYVRVCVFPLFFSRYQQLCWHATLLEAICKHTHTLTYNNILGHILLHSFTLHSLFLPFLIDALNLPIRYWPEKEREKERKINLTLVNWDCQLASLPALSCVCLLSFALTFIFPCTTTRIMVNGSAAAAEWY